MPSERWPDGLRLVRVDFGVEVAISLRGENGPRGKDNGGQKLFGSGLYCHWLFQQDIVAQLICPGGDGFPAFRSLAIENLDEMRNRLILVHEDRIFLVLPFHVWLPFCVLWTFSGVKTPGGPASSAAGRRWRRAGRSGDP